MAFARRLFEQHGGAIQRYFRRLTGDPAAAEDLTQEVFVRVVRGGGQYEPRERERAWVFRIARNVLLDLKRRQARTPVFAAAAEPGVDAPQATRAGVNEALARLPADDREAFLLREIGGLSYAEIALATESTVPAVRSRIYRARLALREMLIPPAPGIRPIVRTQDDHD